MFFLGRHLGIEIYLTCLLKTAFNCWPVEWLVPCQTRTLISEFLLISEHTTRNVYLASA